MSMLYLGRNNFKAVELSPHRLLKHVIALGASGSGKTCLSKVIVEDAVRHNIPVIAIDAQGDISSLGLVGNPDDDDAAKVAADYWSKVDLKIWTPGSEWGLPISMQPMLNLSGAEREEDRIRMLHGMAQELAAVAGFSDEATCAGISKILGYADRMDLEIQNMEDVCNFLRDPPLPLARDLDPIFNGKDRAKVLRALTVKLNGPRQLMFTMGQPIDVDVLFGYEKGGAYDNGKVRVSVINLNALHSQEDQQLFLAALARQVYAWMLQRPMANPVGLFYIDEAAPYFPPVKKPVCKEPLLRLLRQARKYGVCMLIATQSPGDVDFTGMGQIGTKLIGRMTTLQEAHKVTPLLNDVEGGHDLVERLPSLKQGEFIAICPDQLAQPEVFQSRRLITRHETLTLERIGELVSDDDRVTYC